MRLLLDSHIAYWWAGSPESIKQQTRYFISDPSNDVFVSVVSLWELGLKASKGKLKIPSGFGELTEQHGIECLPFQASHAYHSISLPPIHGDPFDRALVAQCIVENITLVTRDITLAQYRVQVLQA